MDQTWSQSEKTVARAAFDRAVRAAESEFLSRHAAYPLASFDDLWELELKIREWRKEWFFLFDYRYSQLDMIFPPLIRKGWLKIEDLDGLKQERLAFYRKALAD